MTTGELEAILGWIDGSITGLRDRLAALWWLWKRLPGSGPPPDSTLLSAAFYDREAMLAGVRNVYPEWTEAERAAWLQHLEPSPERRTEGRRQWDNWLSEWREATEDFLVSGRELETALARVDAELPESILLKNEFPSDVLPFAGLFVPWNQLSEQETLPGGCETVFRWVLVNWQVGETMIADLRRRVHRATFRLRGRKPAAAAEEAAAKAADAAPGRMTAEQGGPNGDGIPGNNRDADPPSTKDSCAHRDKVFISYSHKDKTWLKLLKVHLKPYERHLNPFVWDDSRIKPGDKWREEIQRAIATANVAVLLVSPSFLASDFIAEHELPPLLNAAEEKLLTLMWIPVSHSSFSVTTLEGRHAACDPAKPLRGLSVAKRDEALVDICKKIKAAMGWA